MIEETTVVETTEAAPKAAAKKKAVKKAPKKAPAKSGELRGPSKTQLAVLKVLSRATKGMTRSQLSDRLDGAWVGSDVMGHIDPKKLNPSSLTARGLVKFGPNESDSEREVLHYVITAAGRKALESAKG